MKYYMPFNIFVSQKLVGFVLFVLHTTPLSIILPNVFCYFFFRRKWMAAVLHMSFVLFTRWRNVYENGLSVGWILLLVIHCQGIFYPTQFNGLKEKSIAVEKLDVDELRQRLNIHNSIIVTIFDDTPGKQQTERQPRTVPDPNIWNDTLQWIFFFTHKSLLPQRTSL